MTTYDVTVKRSCVYRTTLRVKADGFKDAWMRAIELAANEDAHGWTADWQDDFEIVDVIQGGVE